MSERQTPMIYDSAASSWCGAGFPCICAAKPEECYRKNLIGKEGVYLVDGDFPVDGYAEYGAKVRWK